MGLHVLHDNGLSDTLSFGIEKANVYTHSKSVCFEQVKIDISQANSNMVFANDLDGIAFAAIRVENSQ